MGRSVGWSNGWSVGQSVGRTVGRLSVKRLVGVGRSGSVGRMIDRSRLVGQYVNRSNGWGRSDANGWFVGQTVKQTFGLSRCGLHAYVQAWRPHYRKDRQVGDGAEESDVPHQDGGGSGPGSIVKRIGQGSWGSLL